MADGGTIVWRTAIGGADQARSDLKSLGPAGAAGAQQTQQAWAKAGAVVGQQINDIAAKAAMPIQQRIDLVVDASGAGSAKASATVFAQAEVQAQALRRAVDPLGAAQARYNAELERYRGLARAGFISADELAKGEQLLRRRLDETTDAIRRQEKEQERLGGVRKGLSTNQKNTLIYTASDIVSSAGSGIDPMRMLMQQGPQVLQAFAVEGVAVSGAFLAASAAAAGFLAVIGGLIVVQDRSANEQARLTVLLEGVGRASGVTAAQIREVADASADTTTQSIKFSREAATAFATQAKVTADNLGVATSLVDRFADATGRKSKDALTVLTEALADPAAGAGRLNKELDFLTAAELRHIKSVEITEGKTAAVKIILDKLNGTLPESGRAVTGLTATFRDWAKAIGDVITKLTTVNDMSAPENRLRLLRQQRELIDMPGGPGTRRDNSQAARDAVAAIDQRIAAVEKEIAEAKAKPEQDRRREQTNRVASAVDTLDPRESQIKDIKDRQEVARKALKGELATDKTPEQLRAAIAAGDREIAQIKKRGEQVDRHAQSLARDSKAMEENTAGALASAQAYLESSELALKADAKRQASTDAARKGADEERRYQAQLGLAVAEAAANGAKAVDQLRAQTSARREANAAVASGMATTQQAERQMQDELALRPLLTAQKVAEGKALEILTRVITAYRQALKDSHDEEARGAALSASAEQQITYEALTRRRALADRAPADRFDEEGVRIASRKRLEGQNIDPNSDEGRNLIARDVYNAQLEREVSRREATADILRDRKSEYEVLAQQLVLIGKSATEQDRLRALKAAELDLADRGISAESEKGRQILAQVNANAILAAQVQQSVASYNELVGVGEQFIDDVLNPQAWKDWGATGKKVAEDLMADFIRLAALNPLKNALFGQNNATLSTVGGLIGSLFGGGSLTSAANSLAASSAAGGAGWDAAFSAASSKIVPGYASGTENHPGGWAIVGEHGRELAWMPPGSRVYDAAKTRAALSPAPYVPAPQVQAAAPVQAPTLNLQVNDYRTSGAKPKITQTGDGIRMDLYDDVGRDMLGRAGATGDLARALGKSPRVKRYG